MVKQRNKRCNFKARLNNRTEHISTIKLSENMNNNNTERFNDEVRD